MPHKYRVKKRAQLLYPDGTVRGEAGYIVDTSAAYDRNIVAEQGGVLQPAERSSLVSPVDLARLTIEVPKVQKKTRKKAKKKTKKTP